LDGTKAGASGRGQAGGTAQAPFFFFSSLCFLLSLLLLFSFFLLLFLFSSNILHTLHSLSI
jgi:hypothetical protein